MGFEPTERRGARVDASDQEFVGLLALAREGNAAAWSKLYHQIAPVVIGYLRAQRLPDPEDVAGEVLLEVVRGLTRFTGNAAGFRSWVLTIAHHRLLDARRREQRRPSSPTAHEHLGAPPATDDPEAETLAALGFGALEPALAELTEDQRSVLLLRVIGDLPIAEVARITGRRPGAVKQLQRRAAASMRRSLDVPAATTRVGAAAPCRPCDRGESAPANDGRPAEPSDERAARDIVGPGNASPTVWTT